ncbi:MAG: hypothetical protein ACP5IZ_10220 [Thermoprotei archaeon]|jgi:hypothetical protein
MQRIKNPMINNIILMILLMILAIVVFYASTLGLIIATRPGDVKWLTFLSEIIKGQPETLILFPYTSWIFSPFFTNLSYAIMASTLLTFILLPFPAFYITYKITNNKIASTLAGILIIIYPLYSWLIMSSNYAQLQGILLLSTSIIFITRFIKLDTIKKGAILVVLSLLTALADTNTALILITTSLTITIINMITKQKTKPALIYPLVSLVSIPIILLNTPQTINIPTDTYQPLIISIISGIPGLYIILKHSREDSITILSWLLACIFSAIIIKPQVTTIYLFYPLAISTSTLFPSIIKGLALNKRSENEELIEIDITKLLGLIIITLLIISSTFVTYNVMGKTIQNYSIYINRYGDIDLLNTLTWINENTPKDAVILAEYPLSSWIQSYTGRTVITNLPTNPNNINTFMKNYDADTILNANYELRNQFIRLRDWESKAPQRSPAIASSDGNNYNEFIYIDENHARVSYTYNSKQLSPDFYQYKSANTTWITRTNNTAILQHTFTLEGGITITKRLTLTTDPYATIEYYISSTASTINSFTLKMWIPWERKLGFTQITGNIFHFSTDTGEYKITFNGNLISLTFGPDETWTQPRVLATFAPIQNSITVKITVEVLNPKPVNWMNNKIIITEDIKELLAKYRISYAIIPTIVKKEYMDKFGLTYEIFKSSYQNDHLTIYKVIIQ